MSGAEQLPLLPSPENVNDDENRGGSLTAGQNRRAELLSSRSHVGFFSDRVIVAKPLNVVCSSHGADRSCPMCSGYAFTTEFWREIAVNAICGVFVGLLCFVLIYPMRELPKKWTAEDYPSNPETLQFFKGKLEWTVIIASFGALVGFLKVCLNYPENPDGFIKQINTQYVNCYEALCVVIVSCVSVAGGSALGPSSSLASLGGALGQTLSEYRNFSDEQLRRDFLGGVAAGLACLLPSPIAPILLISELGPRDYNRIISHYMRYFVELGTGILFAFGVNAVLTGETYLPFLSGDLRFNQYTFRLRDLPAACLIGVVSALVGAVFLIVTGLFVKVFNVFGRLVPSKAAMGLSPCIGGLCIGLLSHMIPLSLGSGNSQFVDVVQLSLSRELSPKLLLCSAFGKLLAVSISIGSGFVGGVLMPLYSIGLFLGLSLFLHVDDPEMLPLAVSVSCFLVGVPGSLIPIPLSHLVTVVAMLSIGTDDCAPMFFSLLVSSIVGTGLANKLTEFARREHLFDNEIYK